MGPSNDTLKDAFRTMGQLDQVRRMSIHARTAGERADLVRRATLLKAKSDRIAEVMKAEATGQVVARARAGRKPVFGGRP